MTATIPAQRPESDDPAAPVWAIVERVQAGEMAAYGELYERYVDVVFRFVYFRVGNRPLAEDLTADTFLRGLQRIGSFTWQGRDIGAWFITIARNLIADHWKRARTRLDVSVDEFIGDLDAADDDAGPAGGLIADELVAAIRAATKLLTVEQQQVIELKYFQGLPDAVVAERIGKDIGAVKALAMRARRALLARAPELQEVRG